MLFFTLGHDKKQLKKQLEIQEQEYLDNLKLMKQQHNEILDKQVETNRVSVMPFFVLNKDIVVTEENGNIYFQLFFSNKGNGTAIELTGKYLKHLSKENLCPLFESIIGVYGCSCPFDYVANTVRPNEECSFSLYQNFNEEMKGPFGNSDQVSFKIMFKDMYLNQYEQEFMFLFNEKKSMNFEILRVASYTPELVKYDK